MTKVIVLLTRKPGMGRAEFRDYWRDVHARFGAAMPGLRRYVQNHPAAEDSAYDGIAEMWFDDAAAADSANFLASGGTKVIIVEEIDVVAGGG